MTGKGPISFRTDASVTIGTGHVMRCLTLADALSVAGRDCHFICRDLPGHMAERIAAHGHEVHLLPAPDGLSDSAATVVANADGGADRLPVHASWAEVDWPLDSRQSRTILDTICPEWLVLDHYSFDRRWQEQATPESSRLLVIDDLADRPHRADVLLDQNLGRTASDYTGLVGEDCLRLIGPTFALLRPQFAAARTDIVPRPPARTPHRLMISMGGIDQNNASGRILAALNTWIGDNPHEIEAIDVIMGGKAPWLEEVRKTASEMPIAAKVHVDVTNMPDLMRDADLAIGAAGATSWERCCLGLPSLVAVLADNQAGIAAALETSGAAIGLGSTEDEEWSDRLERALATAIHPDMLACLSARAAALCDGEGCGRVLTAMAAAGLTVRRADLGDIERVWEWRNSGDATRFYKNVDAPRFDEHKAWFTRALDAAERLLLIVGEDTVPVGHVRFDRVSASGPGAREATVSICLSPSLRGQGKSAPVLTAAMAEANKAGIGVFNAIVHEGNDASHTLFHRTGYVRIGTDAGFVSYRFETA